MEVDSILNGINDLKRDIDSFFEKHKKEFDIINQSNILDSVDAIIDEYSKKTMQKFSDEELQQIYKEGEERYSKEPPQPPGYKDIDKRQKKNYIKNSEYGDFVIWKEIIRYAKNNNVDIIFVINDDKTDWKEKGTLLRKDLIEEFENETNHTIYSISLQCFYSMVSEKFNIEKTKHVVYMLDMKNSNYCKRIAMLAFDKIRGDIEDKIEDKIDSEHIDELIYPEFDIVEVLYEDYDSIDYCDNEDIYYLLFSVTVEVTGHEMLYEDNDESPFEIYNKSYIELQGTVEVGVSINHDDDINIINDDKFSYVLLHDMYFEETGYRVSKKPFLGLETLRQCIEKYQNIGENSK